MFQTYSIFLHNGCDRCDICPNFSRNMMIDASCLDVEDMVRVLSIVCTSNYEIYDNDPMEFARLMIRFHKHDVAFASGLDSDSVIPMIFELLKFLLDKYACESDSECHIQCESDVAWRDGIESLMPGVMDHDMVHDMNYLSGK